MTQSYLWFFFRVFMVGSLVWPQKRQKFVK